MQLLIKNVDRAPIPKQFGYGRAKSPLAPKPVVHWTVQVVSDVAKTGRKDRFVDSGMFYLLSRLAAIDLPESTRHRSSVAKKAMPCLRASHLVVWRPP